jgi:hypothetical protein
MQRVSLAEDFNLPEPDELGRHFPHYVPRATGPGNDLFRLVMNAESMVRARVVTTLLGLPAVTAVAAAASTMRSGDISDTDKQFVGALIRTLMEANGFEKTNRKRAIPVDGWNRGEVYRTRPSD